MDINANSKLTAGLDATMPQHLARIGMIIPAVNRACEPQFNRYAPPTLGVHIMRARIAGKWSRPIVELADEITRATQVLAECGPDLMVYNCTASSMKEGPAGERRILISCIRLPESMRLDQRNGGGGIAHPRDEVGGVDQSLSKQ